MAIGLFSYWIGLSVPLKKVTSQYSHLLRLEFGIQLSKGFSPATHSTTPRYKEIERLLEHAMIVLNKWRSSFILVLILTTLTIGLTQTQAADVKWEIRFNHSLGISFQMPKGYDLIPGSTLNYGNGQSTVNFQALPSRRI